VSTLIRTVALRWWTYPVGCTHLICLGVLAAAAAVRGWYGVYSLSFALLPLYFVAIRRARWQAAQ
jgi:hypothetical protein